MGIVQAAQMSQDLYQHKEGMSMAQQALKLDRRNLNINLVNTIREDLRDLCDQRYGQVDNLLVVNTLVLSFSFGFCCEGTFPGMNGDGTILLYTTEYIWMCLYSIFLGFTFILPFWSIWFALECKLALDDFLDRLFKGDREKRMDLQSWLDHTITFEKLWVQSASVTYKRAIDCFWGGMISSIILCEILTGMNFIRWYHPSVFYIFIILMSINLVFIVIVFYFQHSNNSSHKKLINHRRKGTWEEAPDAIKCVNAVNESTRNLFGENNEHADSPSLSSLLSPKNSTGILSAPLISSTGEVNTGKVYDTSKFATLHHEDDSEYSS